MIFKSCFLKNFKKVRSKNSLIYNFLLNIWSQIHSEWWARTGTWFFCPHFWNNFSYILMWKRFWLSKFLFLWIGLGLYYVGPRENEISSLQPMELETILSKWSKSLYLGLKLKSASWGPISYPRAKLYMVCNTPK